jgi:hypothetical protein
VAAVLAHCELHGVQSAARQRVTALTAYTQSQRQRAPELTVTLDIAAPLLVLPDAPADLQHCRLLLIDLGHIGLVRHRSGVATTASTTTTASTIVGATAAAGADAAAPAASTVDTAITTAAGASTTTAGDSPDNTTVADVVSDTDAATGAASGSSDSVGRDSSSGDQWSLSVHGAHAAVVLDAAAYMNAEEEHDTDIATADDAVQHSAAADNRELLLEPFDVTFEVRCCSFSTLLKQLSVSVMLYSQKSSTFPRYLSMLRRSFRHTGCS